MHYFVIYTRIPLITLGFGFIWVLIVNFCLMSQLLGEKSKVEVKWIQKS